MPNLEQLLRGYAFDDKVLATACADFAPDDWSARPPGGGNHAQWILGHLAATRRAIVRITGGQIEALPWESLFGMDAQPGAQSDALAPDLLRDTFVESGRVLRERLAGLSDDQLAAPIARPMPDGSETVGAAVGFLFFHEAYHLGQLGLLRRMRGKSGVA